MVFSLSENPGGYSLDNPIFIWKIGLMWMRFILTHKFPPSPAACSSVTWKPLERHRYGRARAAESYTEELVSHKEWQRWIGAVDVLGSDHKSPLRSSLRPWAVHVRENPGCPLSCSLSFVIIIMLNF